MGKKHSGDQDRLPGGSFGLDLEPADMERTPQDHGDGAPASALPDVSPGGDPYVELGAQVGFLRLINEHARLFLDGDGYACLEFFNEKAPVAHRVGSRHANNRLRALGFQAGKRPTTGELKETNEDLIACAEMMGDTRRVSLRVAPYRDGVEIDRCDCDEMRIQVVPGEVQVVQTGSDTLFRRTSLMREMPMPADEGNVDVLHRYLNLDAIPRWLLIGWITYVLAHPKTEGTTYPILVVLGDQGSGKSFLCRLALGLVDPSVVGLQAFPRTERDFAIAAQGAHAIAYDNVRSFSPTMADALCRAATGGSLATRQLYTDADQVVHRTHCALILNGIHAFVDQPDLASRCLPLIVRSLDETDRRDEHEMLAELQEDMPRIFKGLLDLTAEILRRLPEAEVVCPERVIGFSRWLAAMELVHGTPGAEYQEAYRDALKSGMLESLLDNPLAAAVLELVENRTDASWSGTPAQLLTALTDLVNRRNQQSQAWPPNATSLSLRLRPLQAGLRRQGLEVQFGRGRFRRITITRTKVLAHD